MMDLSGDPRPEDLLQYVAFDCNEIARSVEKIAVICSVVEGLHMVYVVPRSQLAMFRVHKQGCEWAPLAMTGKLRRQAVQNADLRLSFRGD